MALTERVEVVVDFVEKHTGGKTSPVAAMKKNIGEAEGALGKLKATTAGFSQVAASMGPQLFAAAGAAVVAFGIKAVGVFQKLALESGKFAAATGLSVQESSRWIEVAGDLGVEAGTVEGAFNKLAIAIQKSPEKLAAMGVEIARTKDGAVDMNGTVLNVIKSFDGMDPARRAAAMKEIFGKGAVGGAALFGLSVKEIQERLASVKEGKIIDPEEQAKAERLRDATDELKDSWDEVVLAVGEMGADLAPVIELVGQIVAKAAELNAQSGQGGGGLFEKWTGWKVDFTGGWSDIITKTGEADEAGTTALGNITSAADDATTAVDDIAAAYDELTAKLSTEETELNVADAFDKAREAAIKAAGAAQSHGEASAASMRDNRKAIIDTEQEIVAYAQKVLNLPPERLTHVIALIDQGKIDEAERELAKLAKDREMELKVKVVLQNAVRGSLAAFLPGGAGASSVEGLAAARGPGIESAGAPEAGPGIASVGAISLPPMAVRATQPIVNVQVNLPVGSDESRTVAALSRWSGRNGSLLNAGVRT